MHSTVRAWGPPRGSHARLHGDSTRPLAPPNTPSEALPATVALLTITSASHPLAGTGGGRLELSDERTSGPGRPTGGPASLGSTLSVLISLLTSTLHTVIGGGVLPGLFPAGMAFVNAAVGGAKLTQWSSGGQRRSVQLDGDGVGGASDASSVFVGAEVRE